MLSDQEKQTIDAELEKYGRKQAVTIEALKIIQEHRGWVSDEALDELAAYLDISAEELDSVATFYSLIFRKPVGRHVILICDSVTCWVMGFETCLLHLYKRLGIRLGETTADGNFTLLPIPCLGACDVAPAFMIDNQLYGNLDADKIDVILDKFEQET